MKRLEHLMQSWQQADEAPAPVKADLLLYAPCPVKLVVKERIEAIAAAQCPALTTHIPMGCTSVDPYDPLYMETDAGKLPAVIASIGYGDFWRGEFVRRFVKTGVFEGVQPRVLNPLYADAGLVDPAGAYTIYGVTPYIFLIDHKKLDGLPAPRNWEDLTHPRYRGQIVMCGDGDDMADAVLLNQYKDYGEPGVTGLAANIKSFMHSSRMAKVCGTAAPDAGGIFIIPLFFAESTKLPEHVEIVWPEDGAAASPLYLLAKKSEKERLAPLLNFFANGFGEIDSAAWFIPMDGSRPSRLPRTARLKWVGWDFVENNDVNSLRDILALKFRRLQAGAACGS
ncbi:ABC transporter substrate-binding protein [Desulfovibrio sp.]|uniref:ABC transporter substrate-binding protein n=1 Tax=Desulfovibrio sp. TaxID=885 RepID=UPI0035B02B28